MYTYDRLFSQYNHTIAQILLTGSDIHDDVRLQNFKNTMYRLMELQVIPIINENDTIVTDEICIGDNDTLSAVVASVMDADLLILLSDINGLYTADPHTDPNAKLIPVVKNLDDRILAFGGRSSSSNMGTGGMATKLQAAKMATQGGCDMVIANGSNPNVLYDIIEGKNCGTRFIGKKVNNCDNTRNFIKSF